MRKAKRNVLVLAPALALTFLCAQAMAAPRPANQQQNERPTKKKAADINNYRVKYKVDEVEKGKTINSRSYTMTVENGSSATVRIGSRVPYNTGGSTIQYQDVGMNINCSVNAFGEEGRLILHTKISMMSVAGKGTELSSESNPVFGQFQVENSTVVTLGKETFVGSADDVTSNRRYVVEVTVTKAM